MRTTRLFVDQIMQSNTLITLSTSSTHYLKNVLRLKVGASLRVFNGQGGEYQAQIRSIDKKSTELALGEFVDHQVESPLQLHLVQAVSRADRMDFTLQKAVELGVQSISPVISEYSNLKINDQRASKRFAHWQGILQSATEQSGRTQLAQLNPLQPLTTWLTQSTHSNCLLLEPSAESRFATLKQQTQFTLLIGPEGGFSEPELALAKQHGVQAVSLGPRILRTETAGIAALSLLQGKFGDF